jgi:TolB-like protein
MVFSFEDFILDSDGRELWRGAHRIEVEPQVFDLLEYLIRNRDRVVSKDDLFASVWKGRVVSDATLASRINAARAAIKDNGIEQRLIRTILRKGVRFTANVCEETRSAIAVAGPSGNPPLPDRPSIAVLPFENMSGDLEQEYFADGIAEEIITGLSRIKWFFVIARNSSFIYKNKAVDVKQVGHDLGVRYLLEGSVRKTTNRVRITCQLIDAQTGVHLWAERYDRPLDDVFALQDEITLAVVGAIEPSLRQAEIERVKRKRPDSLDAYHLVLQAIPRVSMLMPNGATEGLALLKRALKIEPDYALAHGFAAWGHHILFQRAGKKADNRSLAIDHAHQAIALGHGDAMPLTLGAFVVSMDEHDRAGAREAFESAVAISPSSAFTYFLGAVALGYAGESERAIEWGERALRLSPFDSLAFLAWHGMCLGLFRLERYAEAVEVERRAAQANPGFSNFHLLVAAALAKLGRIDEAREAAARVLALEPGFTISGYCAPLAMPESLSRPLSDALRAAGLTE